MSQSPRFRPGGHNPLRYQGGLRHYHIAPMKAPVTWEHWVGRKKRRRGRWLGIIGFVLAITAVTAALWR